MDNEIAKQDSADPDRMDGDRLTPTGGRIVRLGRLTLDAAFKKIEEAGCRPATEEELRQYVSVHPDEDAYPVFALGSRQWKRDCKTSRTGYYARWTPDDDGRRSVMTGFAVDTPSCSIGPFFLVFPAVQTEDEGDGRALPRPEPVRVVCEIIKPKLLKE